MARTAISRRSEERGAALIEAALGLALMALIAGAGLTVFTRAAATSDQAAARIEALALAENALERAAAPDFLRRAQEQGEASLEGDAWRVTGARYMASEDSPLALIHLIAEAGAEGPARVRLETLRSLPR